MKMFIFSILFLCSAPLVASSLPTAEEILHKYDTNQNDSLEYRTEILRIDFSEIEKPLKSCVDDSLSGKKDMAKILFVYASKFHKNPEPVELAIFYYLTPKLKTVLTKRDLELGIEALLDCNSAL